MLLIMPLEKEKKNGKIEGKKENSIEIAKKNAKRKSTNRNDRKIY